MSARINCKLILFSVIVLLLALGTQAASARGGIFVVEPKREVVEEINLSAGAGVSSEVVGDLSVTNGSIDFWITSPSGVVVLYDHKIANNSFGFVAKENGNYTMHMSNTYLTQNVTVTLNYGINMNIIAVANLNVGTSASVGVARVVAPPPPPPGVDDPRPNLDDLYERYLNLLEGSKILRILGEGLEYMPVSEMLLAVTCSVLAVGLGMIAKRRRRLKPQPMSSVRLHGYTRALSGHQNRPLS
jgi:hypothetical protein